MERSLQKEKRKHPFLFLLAAMMAAGLSSPCLAESQKLSMNVDGIDHTYILHIPVGYDATRHYPLMLAYHGAYSTAGIFEQTTGFDNLADQQGFFVVYPDSIGPKWHFLGEGNDIFFGERLIQEIGKNYHIDPARIYASGFSEGGGMAQALACFDTSQLSGIAVVAENLKANFVARCHPSRPINFLLFHGTADPISPYEGGISSFNGAITYSARQTAEFWVKQDRCSDTPEIRSFGDRLSDGNSVMDSERSWFACADGTGVIFYTIQGGGHTWPGGGRKSVVLGLVSLDTNASQIIWNKFSSGTFR